MRMYLWADGVWRLHSRTEGIKCYDDLPQKAKNILNMVMFAVPFGWINDASERRAYQQKTNPILRKMTPERTGVYRQAAFFMYDFGHESGYRVDIDTKLLKEWKRKELKIK